MNVTKLGVASFFCALVAAAGAQGLEFKGLPFGTSYDDFKAAQPQFECYGGSTCRHLRGASPVPPYYAGDMVQSVTAEFLGAKGLAHVRVAFFPHNFGKLTAAIESKYGPPTSVRPSEFRTKGGAVAQQEVREWAMPDGGIIYVSRYGASLDDGFALMSSADYLAASKAAREDQAKKAKKDI